MDSTGALSSEPEPVELHGVEVGSELADRGERLRPGEHGAHRDGEQSGKGVTHAPRVTWVGHLGKSGEQVGAFIGVRVDHWGR